MAVYIGDTLIAGSFKAGASWEVGDVGISAFGIDEALNKRRYLNGQVISQAQFVEFTAMLKSRVSVYPSLATTEVNWQAEVTNSKLGQCGKFVIDDDAGTIRLPKVVNLQGLMDLTHLGETVEAGLPNIEGTFTLADENYTKDYGFNCTNDNLSGCFTVTPPLKSTTGLNASGTGSINQIPKFDASLSNSIYGNSTTVQPESIQYPYFIQVAEGIENSVDVSREIELNNPFSLLDYKYSEYELSNASWLLSNGQFNSGATYPAVYNLLLQIYNGTVTKAGVSVKLSTETYADTDFVLNTGDTTFRLPIKVLMAGSKRVAGNGMTLGLTDGTHDLGFYEGQSVGAKPGSYNVSVGTVTSGSNYNTDYSLGITTDETKSGIETSANGLYLYFYAGETVQDANIIAAGQALTDIADLKNASNFSSLGKETVVGWGMPDFSRAISVSNGDFTAPENGYINISGHQINKTKGLSIKEKSTNTTLTQFASGSTDGNFYFSSTTIVEKGKTYVVAIDCPLLASQFIPMKG